MNQICISIMLLGFILIVFSFVLILIDAKKTNNYVKMIDSKKAELEEIISDAEGMLEELNRFSDYVVSKIETKNEEILKNIDVFENRSKSANEILKSNHAAEEGSSKPATIVHGSDLIIDRIDSDVRNISHLLKKKSKRSNKIIPLNSRYKEVLKLARNGYSDTEIAKNLCMGKGEIQLIMEINK